MCIRDRHTKICWYCKKVSKRKKSLKMIRLKIVCKHATTHTTSELVVWFSNYNLRISQITNQPSGRATTTGYCFSMVYKCYIFKLVRFEKKIYFSSSCPLFVILTHCSRCYYLDFHGLILWKCSLKEGLSYLYIFSEKCLWIWN